MCTVYVSGIPQQDGWVDEDGLREYFAEAGAITRIDMRGGGPFRLAFVHYETPAAASKACELDGVEFRGSELQVRLRKTPEEAQRRKEEAWKWKEEPGGRGQARGRAAGTSSDRRDDWVPHAIPTPTPIPYPHPHPQPHPQPHYHPDRGLVLGPG